MPTDNCARLPDFILREMDAIQDIWEISVAELAPGASSTPDRVLRGHAQAVLSAIAADLQESQAHAGHSRRQSAAEQHASHSLAAGFSINRLIAEYRALRSSVLKRWAECPREALSTDASLAESDIARFHEAVDQALAEAVAHVDAEQMQAEAALRESEAKSGRRQRLYEALLENSPDLAYVFDLNHRFTYANKVLLEMWSKSWDESIGKNCFELGYEPWHAEMHGREIEQVKATKRPVKGEVPFDGAFGRRVYEYIFVPVFGPDGEVEAVAGTTRDVTERKEDEVALRESNRLKDEFLALLAHELRNPLAPISAAAQALPMLISDEKLIRRTAEVILRQVKHLTGLVDDLLDVSRVTRGLVNLHQSPNDMKSVVYDAVEQVRPLIESFRHHLRLEMDAEATYVEGDQKRLVQIVTNLLNNAAKYTPQGGNIALSIKVEDERIQLSIEDDGIGIAQKLQPHIFDLFAQAERTADRSQGGLGIGLALVKSLTELQGGSVSCFSEGEGKGSCFTVSFPRLREAGLSAPETAGMQPAVPTGPARRILVVDDNEDAARLLALNLQLLGHEALVEHSAQAALDRAGEFKPEVCILDIGLPVMDGNELARRLRTREDMKSALLIAITGYGQEKDKALSKAAGFDQHMVKPVDMALLLALLA